MLMASLALLGGCRSANDIRRMNAVQLYDSAHKAMLGSDYEYAIRQYEALTARFPFTNQARQARLDLIYVYYRKGETDSAIDAADQFLRENPTHPRVDYAWYMKGLVNFERTPWAIERWFGVDMAKRPPTTAQKAITAFSTVVTQYPNSDYAFDSLRRMTYLRNRLAEYDLYVAQWYVKRGAWVAAAQRANDVLEQYDGAPAVPEALRIEVQSYRQLGFNDLAANAQRVYDLNFPSGPPRPSVGKRWWQFWR
jgi:outer membrane protein assembly factor BamD